MNFRRLFDLINLEANETGWTGLMTLSQRSRFEHK